MITLEAGRAVEFEGGTASLTVVFEGEVELSVDGICRIIRQKDGSILVNKIDKNVIVIAPKYLYYELAPTGE